MAGWSREVSKATFSSEGVHTLARLPNSAGAGEKRGLREARRPSSRFFPRRNCNNAAAPWPRR